MDNKLSASFSDILDLTVYGRNDKLLPAIEIPEKIGGRTFFQWRYSYSGHTSNLYSGITNQRTINFFPPPPEFLDLVIKFAKTTDSPFIISADTLFSDERLELLGTVNFNNEILSKYKLHHTGLTGDVYLFGIKKFKSNSFSEINYSRTNIIFNNLNSSDSLVKLPITYFDELKALDAAGGSISLFRGEDGFAYIDNKGNINHIKITSFSWITFFSLCAPLISFIIMSSLLFIIKLFRFDT